MRGFSPRRCVVFSMDRWLAGGTGGALNAFSSWYPIRITWDSVKGLAYSAPYNSDAFPLHVRTIARHLAASTTPPFR